MIEKILNDKDFLSTKEYYKTTVDTLIAIQTDIQFNTYHKFSFEYPYLILSEVYYRAFIKQNKLNYKIKKYQFKFIDGKYINVEDNFKNDDEQKEVVSIYECTLQPIGNVETETIFDTKLKELEILSKKENVKKPTLIIHSCCGPCSSYVLEYLHNYFQITVYYYNPNIFPEEEFYKRVETQKEIISKLNYPDVLLIVGDYNHKNYSDAIKGLENLGEFSKRCYNCYYQRLEEMVKNSFGKYDYFTTTLSISPYKNSQWINEIGLILANKYNMNFLYSNFKLHNGYKRSIELSKKYDLYRQDYCGCEYSMRNMNKK